MNACRSSKINPGKDKVILLKNECVQEMTPFRNKNTVLLYIVKSYKAKKYFSICAAKASTRLRNKNTVLPYIVKSYKAKKKVNK